MCVEIHNVCYFIRKIIAHSFTLALIKKGVNINSKLTHGNAYLQAQVMTFYCLCAAGGAGAPAIQERSTRSDVINFSAECR